MSLFLVSRCDINSKSLNLSTYSIWRQITYLPQERVCWHTLSRPHKSGPKRTFKRLQGLPKGSSKMWALGLKRRLLPLRRFVVEKQSYTIYICIKFNLKSRKCYHILYWYFWYNLKNWFCKNTVSQHIYFLYTQVLGFLSYTWPIIGKIIYVGIKCYVDIKLRQYDIFFLYNLFYIRQILWIVLPKN